MHRSIHASKALEVIVSDLFRPSLRQQRAQRFFQQCRGFGTGPPVQRPETMTIAHIDDRFIPFRHEGPQQVPSVAGSGKKSHKPQREVSGSEGGTEAHEWHAELELVAPFVDEQSLHSHAGVVPLDAPAQQGTKSTSKTSTSIAHRQKIVDSIPIPGPAAATDGKSRAESRQDRKLRRMEAGKYNRAPSEARTKEEMVNYQVETVLHKLDAEVDGPRQARAKALERFKKRESVKQAGDKWAAAKSDKAATAKDRWDGPKPKKEVWQVQKGALEYKFGETGWQPRKRLSPDTLEGIRALHASDPAAYCTETLSEHFKVTPEAIRRILKSKWRPDDEETEDRRNRWERRGVKKWQDMAEQGARPPAKWRAMGVGSEEGPKEDKVPKRRKKSRSDGNLSWDEVVGGSAHKEDLGFDSSLAERIL